MGGKAERNQAREPERTLSKAQRRELGVLGTCSGVRSFDEAKSKFSYPVPDNKQAQSSPALA